MYNRGPLKRQWRRLLKVMKTVATILQTIAAELAKQAKDKMPEIQINEKILREWYEKGIYYRETEINGIVYQNQYDFKQRELRILIIDNK